MSYRQYTGICQGSKLKLDDSYELIVDEKLGESDKSTLIAHYNS